MDNNNKTPNKTTIITSGTMGELNGHRVGCDVVHAEGTYTLNGEEKKGITAMLSPAPREWITVGAGSEITVEGSTWRVVKIEDKDVYLEEIAQ